MNALQNVHSRQQKRLDHGVITFISMRILFLEERNQADLMADVLRIKVKC